MKYKKDKMREKIGLILVDYRFKGKDINKSIDEILSLLDENKNRLTGVSAVNDKNDNSV